MTNTFTLNNGVEMPALGFGVFQTPPDETADAVAEAGPLFLPGSGTTGLIEKIN